MRDAYPNQHTRFDKFSFTPDDPYFHSNTPAPGWPGQWRLNNEITPGPDACVLGACNRNITGKAYVSALWTTA